MTSSDHTTAQGTIFIGGVIVIPTRNRADLAVNAIRSVLDQSGGEIEVIVSDNSTSAKDIEALESFCRDLRDERLRYLRPDDPLPMSAHWEWALNQAEDSRFHHFAFLTDRMIFKPGSLKTVTDLVRQYPDKILVYMHDKVFDHSPPFTVYQYEWTGKLLDVSSRRLLELSAESVMYDGSCPRLLNCFVPRRVLNTIRRRFGTVCSSIAPDWNFGYRALEVVDSIHFLHQAALVHYAQARSNGDGPERGIMNEAYLDFLRLLPKPLNGDAPFPEIRTVWNTIISEYCTVKREAASPKFPELDIENYIKALASGVAALEDPVFKQQMEEKLMARGWQPEVQLSLARKLVSPRRILRKLMSTFTRPRRLEFKTAREALDYAAQRPHPKSLSVTWEEDMLQAKEVRLQHAKSSQIGVSGNSLGVPSNHQSVS